MKTKICTECKIEKDLTYFSKHLSCKFGVRSICKQCIKLDYELHKEERKIKSHNYYLKNKEHICKKSLEWKNNNPEKRKETRRRYEKNKLNVNTRLAKSIRLRIRDVLNGRIKSAPTLNLLGCTIKELRNHLESQFKEGMNWDNHAVHGWHIDHKIPCAKFDLSKSEEQRKCFNYTNLQPLWAEENWKKSDKLDYVL